MVVGGQLHFYTHRYEFRLTHKLTKITNFSCCRGSSRSATILCATIPPTRTGWMRTAFPTPTPQVCTLLPGLAVQTARKSKCIANNFALMYGC